MSGSSLATAAARGVAWTFLATATGRLVSLVGLSILARLLAPAEFGLLAFALVYITYAETIGDLGTAMALVYWPSRTEEAAQVTFVVNLALGVVWFGFTILLAPAVAAFFGNPAGEAVLHALAWSFLLKALGNTHDALCQKAMRFRARLAPEVGMAAVKAGVAVLLAWAGFGVWSLVWGQLAGLGAWTVFLWIIVPWRPRWSWPAGLLGPMLGYGRGIVAVNVLAAVTHHADLVVVGKMLGATALGFYQMAYKVPEMTITVLLWVTSKVLFPAFSRIRAEGGSLGEAYLNALRYVSFLTLPAAVALTLLAEPLVRVFFGDGWEPAVPILRALAVYAGLRSLGTPAGDVLKALGRPGLLAALGVVKAGLLLPALVVSARFGPTGVAVGLAAVTAITMLLSVAVGCRLARIRPRDVLRAVATSLLGATLLGLVLLAWDRMTTLPATLGLVGGAITGFATYALVVRALSPGIYRAATSVLRGPRAEETGPTGEVDRFLVPLGERTIARFFLRDLFVPHSLRQRVLGRLARAAGDRFLWPLLCRREGDGWGTPLEMVSAAVAPEGGGLLRGTSLEGRALGFVLLRDHAPEGRERLVVFLFAGESERPAAVLKLRHLGGAGPSLTQEAETLHRVADRLPVSLRTSVPEVLALRAWGSVEALMLSGLPGRSAYVEMQGRFVPRLRVARHFEAAAAWLAAFHTATRTGRVLALEEEKAGVPREADRGFYDDLQRCAGSPLPLAFSHGDFWARNLLLSDASDGPIGVVDWEHGSEEAPFYEDLFHFPLSYGRNYLWSRYRRRAPEEAFRLTFLAETTVARETRRYLRRYCAQTGLDPVVLRPLFHLYLCTRFRRPRGGAPANEGGLWLQFHRMLARADRSVFSG